MPSETRDWLNLGKFIHGVEGKDAEKAFGRFVGRPVTSDFSQAAGTQLRQLDPIKAAEKIVSSINLSNIIAEDDDNLTAKNLNNNPILKELGIEFSSDNAYFDDEIIFTKPFVTGEESPTIRIPINSPAEIQAANQTIRAIISTYGNEDAMRKYGMDSAPRAPR